MPSRARRPSRRVAPLALALGLELKPTARTRTRPPPHPAAPRGRHLQRDGARARPRRDGGGAAHPRQVPRRSRRPPRTPPNLDDGEAAVDGPDDRLRALSSTSSTPSDSDAGAPREPTSSRKARRRSSRGTRLRRDARTAARPGRARSPGREPERRTSVGVRETVRSVQRSGPKTSSREEP